MVYGDTAPDFRERFVAGAFGPVSSIDLNLQHDRSVVLVRGASLTDTPEALLVRAELPEAAAALSLVRRGALNGFSVEFVSRAEHLRDGIRIVERADLTGLALVDRGAYPAAKAEVRQKMGRTLRQRIPADTDLECRCSGAQCKWARIIPQAMQDMIDRAFREATSQVVSGLGSYSDAPLASVARGTMRGRVLPGGDGEVEIDVPASPTGQAVMAAHEAAPLVVRPHLDLDLAESEIEGETRIYRTAPARGFVVSATDARQGWPEAELVATPDELAMAPEAPGPRRRRVWL